MNNRKLFDMLSLVFLFMSQAGNAAELDGQTIPSEISINNSTFINNGCGTREMFWHQLYQVSLYLEEKTSDHTVVLDNDTAKIIRLQVLYEDKLPEEIPGVWQEPLEEEISKEMFGLVQDLYDDIGTGDIVLFIYESGGATTVSLNGDNIISERNSELVNTMLENWLGNDPVSGNLKRLLLDKTCP